MSGSQTWKPWSNNPNAPKITYPLYFDEKSYLAGAVISSMLYGIVILLFFQCTAALFDSTNRRGERIKWGLVCYTTVMFSVVTVQTAMDLDLQSISYINNRDFPGVNVEDMLFLPPGPVGYQLSISQEALSIVPNAMFTLTNWLADGLLLYRCYVVYSKNIWVIAFPCLVYLGSIAMGIMITYQNATQINDIWSAIPYFSISLSLNIILTLMIVIRLILHTRNTRTALGIAGIGGLCKTIITMLIESCALYAVSSLLVIGPWGAGDRITNFFLFILPETQVIAPLLVIQRVANKSALTSNTVASARVSEFEARAGGGSAGDSDIITSGYHMSSVGGRGVDSSELGVTVETMMDFHQDKA